MRSVVRLQVCLRGELTGSRLRATDSLSIGFAPAAPGKAPQWFPRRLSAGGRPFGVCRGAQYMGATDAAGEKWHFAAGALQASCRFLRAPRRPERLS
jgi:hypothetical protein